MTVFSRNRLLAVLFYTISSIFAWYGTILITNKELDCLPIPNNNQFIGLVIGLILAIGVGIKECFTIIRED